MKGIVNGVRDKNKGGPLSKIEVVGQIGGCRGDLAKEFIIWESEIWLRSSRGKIVE